MIHTVKGFGIFTYSLIICIYIFPSSYSQKLNEIQGWLPYLFVTLKLQASFFYLRCCHSVISDSLQPHGLQHARLSRPSPSHGCFLKLMSIELVLPSKYLTLPCPLLPLPSICPSIRVFSNEPTLHSKWPKHWSFRFSISSSNEYSGLISFMIDWLISLQSKELLRVFSSTTVQKRQFFSFMVLLSHPYMATEKNINLTIWTFVGKVMSPLFYMLSRFVTAFLLKSECLLISWLQLPSTESPRKCLSLFPLFPHLFAMKSWDLMPWS